MSKVWLLDPSVMTAIERAPQPSADQISAFRAEVGDAGDPGNVMVKAGDTARINVYGVLTSAPDWISMIFGGGNTVYGDIVAAIDAAESDPAVKKVEFMFNSPGGEAQPVSAVGDKIAAMVKPTVALVENAASAAYWLASQCGSIVAAGRASTVGSIGVVVSMVKPSESMTIDVTSSHAPNKRPDPETPEGQAAIRETIDQMEDLFVTAVAMGRDTSVENVHNNYGKGGLLLAQQALEAGMIDSIGQPKTDVKPQSSKTGAKTMDLETLKAEHPGLFAQVFAQGQEAGASAEKDRIKYHLNMGKRMGAESIAIEACLNGSAKDDGELTASYLEAGVKKRAIDDRGADEAALQGNVPNAATEEAKQAAHAASIFSVFGGAK